jgi:hypothetical protein
VYKLFIKDQKWNAGNYKVIHLDEWHFTHNYGYPNRYSEQLFKAVLYFIRIDRIDAGVSKIRIPVQITHRDLNLFIKGKLKFNWQSFGYAQDQLAIGKAAFFSITRIVY